MEIKILHYVYFAHPITSGYTVRTHSIVKAQKRNGLHPTVAVSLKSDFKNYFNDVFFSSKNVIEEINYYSPHKELLNNSLFKYSKKLLTSKNKIGNYLRNIFYSSQKHQILKNYYQFLESESKRIDLVHAHTPAIALNEALHLSNLSNKKTIYEVRGFWNLSDQDNNQDVTKLVLDDIYASKKADKCVAICKGIADVLVKGGIPSNKIEIVPNAVDPEKFPTMEKNLSLTKKFHLENKVVFGYITSVRWFEGIQTIIKAWPKILQKIPNAVFLLIGDGPYIQELKSFISELGIEKSFLILGRIPHNEILLYYSLIDIFVVPRINVPVSNIVTPLKPLEAMMNQKAIIVSDVNALKEMVVDGETGIHFKADDASHLAEICIQLANDEELRSKLGKDAREWVIKNRTWDIIANQYSDIYKDMLN